MVIILFLPSIIIFEQETQLKDDFKEKKKGYQICEEFQSYLDISNELKSLVLNGL